MMTPLLLLSLWLGTLPLQTFTMIGMVRDTNGQPITNVRVSLVDENFSPRRTIFVDSSGRFKITGLGSGVYLIQVETTGTPYEEQTQRHDLNALRIRGRGDEPYLVDFVLKLKKTSDVTARNGTVFAQDVPENARAAYERGASSLKNNKPEQGFAALKKAIEIFPDYFLALELLGTEYVKRGEFQTALPLLTRALEINSRAPASLYALGVAHLKLSQWDESIAVLQKAATLDGSNPNVFLMLGLSYGYHQLLEPSEAALKKAYQLGGARAAEAHLYLAGIYNKQEKYSDAIHELELYLKEIPDLKDQTQIRTMIENLKAKERAAGK